MWYNIVPSFAIVTVALFVPQYATFFINKLVVDNTYRRRLVYPIDKVAYLRDRHLNTDSYATSGLETIPDN